MTAKLTERQRATQEAVRAKIEGKRAEPGAVIFRLLLIVMLLASLLILVVLLADIFAGAWATFRDRGLDFVLSGLSEVDYCEIRQKLLDSREEPDQ